MKKKSQLFLFDLIFAFVLLVIAIGLYYLYYVDVNENSNIYDLNVNILNGFTNTKINDLNDREIRDLFIANKIKNVENTVAEQVVDFYVTNKSSGDAQYLTGIFVKDYVDKQMNFLLTIENETGGDNMTLYRYPPSSFRVSFENSTVSTMAQRTIFSFKNQSDFYGPFIFRVKIWQ